MTTTWQTDIATLHVGDCREILGGLPDASCQACITSPPY